MAINVKKGVTKPTVNSMKDFLAELQKDKGEEIGSFGGKLVDAGPHPDRHFPLDLAMAGGFPRGFASIIFGPRVAARPTSRCAPSPCISCSGRTQTSVFFDIENSFDPLWARASGRQHREADRHQSQVWRAARRHRRKRAADRRLRHGGDRQPRRRADHV